MNELKQNKIWSDSLNSTLGFDEPWDYVDKPLHKFICFGAGDAGADGDGGGGDAAAYGMTDQDLDDPVGPAGPAGPGSDSSGGGGAFGGPASNETMGYGEFSGFGDAFGGLGAVSGPAGPGFGGFGSSETAAVAIPLALELLTPPAPPPLTGVDIPAAPVTDMDDFGPLGRSDIADALGGRAVNPGFSFFGFNTGIGRGMFGDYGSEDAATAAADAAAGLGTSDVGSFSPLGFGKSALGTLGGPAVTAAMMATDTLTGVPGTGTFGALGNVFSGNAPTSDDDDDATNQGAIGMASGGDLKDIMGFLSPAYGIGRAVKKEGLEGLMAHLSPAFAMSQGKLPMGLDNLMGSKAPAPAPAARSTEAPVQAGPAPTIDELEELQNVAVMQQVLAGQPVEAQRGGLVSAFAMGGMPSPYFEGRVVGPGDGMSDSIPFSIEGQQPAILSRDEYVLPADIVSMMGNGSSDAGAGKIDSFINDFRVQKYGRGEQPPETNKGLSSIA